MTFDEKLERKRLKAGLTYTIIAVGLALLLITPVTLILIFEEDDNGNDIPYGENNDMVSGDMSMDEASKQLWMEYLSGAPEIDIGPGDVDPVIEQVELNRIGSIPEEVREDDGEYNKNVDPTSWEGDERDQSDDDAMMDGDAEAPGSNGGQREVEESDIVKVVDDRMYVLNTYLGLVVVNLEDPAMPFIEGRVSMMGYPVSMYVVDFLGFIIVSGIPVQDEDGYRSSGRMYIVDLTYPSDPRIVQYVDIDGYPVDSRRVGEVIYVISNEESYYYFGGWERGIMVDMAMEMDDGVEVHTPSTHIISIGFHDPEELGLVERMEIEGNSGKVHASEFVIFIPQEGEDWDSPSTVFRYIDISDPEGDIKERGSIEVDGYLRDRFQMDHYRGMFRVVTQDHPEWEMEDRFPSSTLRVIDARDPDDMSEISSLLIDDEGNLMATRFAGERAYTIHLPETIDPLDVIDLSDPSDPELTDILEIPGWVEHLEVLGERIIAVGVDNEQEMKVALYFFDVTDPYNAELTDRVVIGDGYTYSQANWDEKALTVLPEMGLVALPYTTYDWERYQGATNGLQFISFDMNTGDLELQGSIEQMGQISRSKAVGGYMVATSENLLQSIDITDLAEPEIVGILSLARDHRDAFISEGDIVSLIQPPYGSSGARIEVSDISSPMRTKLSIGPEDLQFERFHRDGDMVIIKGIRQGEGYEIPLIEVHRYDMTDPLSPVHYRVAQVELPPLFDYMEQHEKYPEEDLSNEEEPVILYYDPTQLSIMDDGSVVIYYPYIDYYMRLAMVGETSITRMAMVEWQAKDVVETTWVDLDPYVNIHDVFQGAEGSLLVETYRYPEGYELVKVQFHEEQEPAVSNISLNGDVIGISGNGSYVYTYMNYYLEDRYGSTLNIYDISGETPSMIDVISLNDTGVTPHFQGDRIVLISSYGRYYGGYGYMEDDVVYDETVKSPEEPDSWEPQTKVHIIDLDQGIFGSDTSIAMQGEYYSHLVLEDLVVMGSSNGHVAIEIDDEGGHRTFTWWSQGWISGGDIEGDNAVIAMGMYGVETLDL